MVKLGIGGKGVAVRDQADALQPGTGRTGLELCRLQIVDRVLVVDTHNPMVIPEDKKGHIPAHLPDILQRLELDSRHL